MHSMTSAGHVVVNIDNRGSYNRGINFEAHLQNKMVCLRACVCVCMCARGARQRESVSVCLSVCMRACACMLVCLRYSVCFYACVLSVTVC